MSTFGFIYCVFAHMSLYFSFLTQMKLEGIWVDCIIRKIAFSMEISVFPSSICVVHVHNAPLVETKHTTLITLPVTPCSHASYFGSAFTAPPPIIFLKI
jgi:hypothetical protein